MRAMGVLGVALGAVLGAAACTPSSEPEAEAGPSAASSPAAPSGSPSAPIAAPTIVPRAPADLIPASDLIGEWRVAGVDGQANDGPYAITASISRDRIHVVADCINVAWSYAAEAGTIETKRAPVEGCGRGMTAYEEALVAVIDSATGFRRIPSNAVEIFSSTRRVTLFSQ